MNRELTEGEKSFIRSIAARLDPTDAARLINDFMNVRAEPTLEDGSLIVFHIADYVRPHTRGQHTYPYEGVLKDVDGAEVDALLFADPDERLFQLEFLRWADGPLQEPDWSTLRIVHNGERG